MKKIPYSIWSLTFQPNYKHIAYRLYHVWKQTLQQTVRLRIQPLELINTCRSTQKQAITGSRIGMFICILQARHTMRFGSRRFFGSCWFFTDSPLEPLLRLHGSLVQNHSCTSSCRSCGRSSPIPRASILTPNEVEAKHRRTRCRSDPFWDPLLHHSTKRLDPMSARVWFDVFHNAMFSLKLLQSSSCHHS